MQAEGRNLQQQVAILAPDVKQKRLDAFRAKEEALQGAAQRKDEQLKLALAQGQQAMEAQLGPILQQLVKERGANLVLDKQAVVSARAARNVSAWFGKNKVLERVSLDMPPGRVTALIGPSGCGKSTFLRILNRMHEMVSTAALAGEVLLAGEDIYDGRKRPSEIRRRIGIV